MGNDNSIMWFVFSDKPLVGNHIHKDIEILYVLEGNLRLWVENDSYFLKEKEFLVINRKQEHRIQGDDPILYASIYIDYHLLLSHIGAEDAIFWCGTADGKTRIQESMRSLMDQILNHYFDKGGHTRISLNSLYYQLLYLLVTHFSIQTIPKASYNDNEAPDGRTQEIEKYIYENYSQKITLGEMASDMYISVGYLSKLFKKNFGCGFIEYLNSIRLYHAMEDLLYTKNSITKIALDNGFPNIATFNRLFRAAYQDSPASYRLKRKEEMQKQPYAQAPQEKVQQYLDRVNQFQEHLSVSEARSITVRQTEMDPTCTKIWNKIINVGGMAELLQEEMQAHILHLANELHFTHVRFWNIFEEIVFYEGDKAKANFMKLDRLLDFLVANHLSPFIELTYKPHRVHLNVQDALLADSWTNVFRTRYDAFAIISQLARHIAIRYSIEEIRKWCFELNWPRRGIGLPDGWYCEMFTAVFRTFKQLSLDIQVGGFGMVPPDFPENNRQRLQEWKASGVKPDFISIYSYPYEAAPGDELRRPVRSSDSSFLLHQLWQVKDMLQRVGFGDVPLYVTQWGNTISNRNVLNDSCFKGAYIVKNMIECLGHVDAIAYWYGSDLSGEAYDIRSICCGDCGLLAANGAKKPAFYAMSFLNHLGGKLLGKDENCIVTAHEKGRFHIVCHNYKHYGYKFFMDDEDKLDRDRLYTLFEDNEPITLRFSITDVTNGSYYIQTLFINNNNGSVQDEIMRLEKSIDLTRDEADYLRQVSIPHMRSKIVQVADGTLTFETTLLPNEIQDIHIQYQFDI